MAKCCPRACGRLSTAAIFISIGIVQLIAGIILLKSEYVSLLSGPNFWTASSNIAVGVLLGIASTTWKTINKNSSKHASRRKLLAALVGSVFLLNATTASMLIIGEGNRLLAIDLEKEKGSGMEILAYAYATSVCLPIVCVVVSVAFLTGICFRQKPKSIKTLDFKNISNEDSSQRFDWVYSSNLPKPNPEIFETAFYSESESSSSDSSDSDDSSDLPVPLYLRSRSPLHDIENSYHGPLRNSPLPFSLENRSLHDSLSPNFERTNFIPRLNKSSVIITPVASYKDETINAYRNSKSGSNLMKGMVAYRSNSKPGTPIRIDSKPGTPIRIVSKPGTPVRIDSKLGTPIRLDSMPETPIIIDSKPGTPIRIDSNPGTPFRIDSKLETPIRIDNKPKTPIRMDSKPGTPIRIDSKPATPIRIGTTSMLEQSTCSPNFQSNSVLYPCPKAKLSFSLETQGIPLAETKRSECLVRNGPSMSLQSSLDDSTDCVDSVHEVSELPIKAITCSPNPHKKILRTSTTDQTKVQSELENLDNSVIPFDIGVTAFKELYLDETLPEIKDKQDNGTFRSGGDLSILVRNSNFRKKLSSKLVPATGPVVSDNHSFCKTSNRRSTRSGRVKPYSKSKNDYDKYLQTGFSSFKDIGQVDEVESMRHPKQHNSSMSKSPMTSISEKPGEDESNIFMPSTSTHTSGYMTASYEEESEDEADPDLSSSVHSRQQPSPAQKLIADEIRQRYRKRTERVSFELDNDRLK